MSSFKKTIHILFPLIIYYLISTLVQVIGTDILRFFWGSESNGTMQVLTRYSSQFAVYLNALGSVVAGSICFFYYLKDKENVDHKECDKKKTLKLQYLLWAVLAICAAVGFNIVLSNLPIFTQSQSYEQVAGAQYSVSVIGGILCFGIAAPFAEEIVFRALIYNRMRKFFAVVPSMIVSAFIFGAYHGNVVQLVYAFIMGILLAYEYERSKSLFAAFFLHAVANISVYLVSSYTPLNAFANQWILGSALIIMSFIILKIELKLTDNYNK